MPRTRSQSVNDIYDDSFANDSGNHDDIYSKASEIIHDSDVSGDLDSEFSFDPERESFGSVRDPASDSMRMPPPPSKSPTEMELRKLDKNVLITKYLELHATENELRTYNRKIILYNRRLNDEIESLNDEIESLNAEIESLLEDITKQNAIIDVLKMGKNTLQREKAELHSNYELLKARVSDLTGRKPIQGGRRTRRK
jgi:hypothetical protein